MGKDVRLKGSGFFIVTFSNSSPDYTKWVVKYKDTNKYYKTITLKNQN